MLVCDFRCKILAPDPELSLSCSLVTSPFCAWTLVYPLRTKTAGDRLLKRERERERGREREGERVLMTFVAGNGGENSWFPLGSSAAICQAEQTKDLSDEAIGERDRERKKESYSQNLMEVLGEKALYDESAFIGRAFIVMEN